MKPRISILIALLAVVLALVLFTYSPLAQPAPAPASASTLNTPSGVIAVVSAGGNYIDVYNPATGQLKDYKLAGSPFGKLILTWPGVIGLYNDETYLYVIFDNLNVQQWNTTTGNMLQQWQLNP